MQPSAASWLTVLQKSYHWLIQRSLMQLKYFWQRNNKKMKCFKCLAKFATIDEKGLSKQVYPWDHCSVVYSNSSINHRTICKDLPERVTEQILQNSYTHTLFILLHEELLKTELWIENYFFFYLKELTMQTGCVFSQVVAALPTTALCLHSTQSTHSV